MAERFEYVSEGLALSGELETDGARDRAPLAIVLPGFWRRAASPVFAPLTLALRRRGMRVLRLDMRGHGRSDGTYTFGAAESRDLVALLRLLETRREPVAEIWGVSMGGTTAVLALDALEREGGWPRELRRLALVSAPAGIPSLKLDWFTPKTLKQLRAREAVRPPRFDLRAFPPRARVLEAAQTAGRALARHGVDATAFHCATDWLIPVELGRELYEALGPVCRAHYIVDEGRLHADALLSAHLGMIMSLVEPDAA